MPVYGAPDLGIEYAFIAVVPFDAEHPIGSGQVVHYNPGDPFPGEDWGNAAHNLVEVGKAVRLAVNIGGGSQPAAAPVVPETELTADQVNVLQASGGAVTSYPVAGSAGWWTLSDGSKVRGEEAALEAQAELDAEDLK